MADVIYQFRRRTAGNLLIPVFPEEPKYHNRLFKYWQTVPPKGLRRKPLIIMIMMGD